MSTLVVDDLILAVRYSSRRRIMQITVEREAAC